MRTIIRIFLCCTIGLFNCANSVVALPLRDIYISQIGVREATGRNDGKEVEMYLHHVKLPKGNAWCGAFVSWCLSSADIPNPKSGWAPSYFPENKVVWTFSRHATKTPQATPRCGDVFGIFFASKKRIAHVGFIDKFEGSRVVTVEGNTNEAGSREGDGVYRKRRLLSQIYKVSRWEK